METEVERKARQAKYQREWYARNKEQHKALVAKNNARYRKENRLKVIAYLSTHPCVDCGETDVRVLEFDHFGDKIDHVSRMINNCIWPKVEAEIAKCEVRCANHHRIKTCERMGNTWHSKYN